MSPPRPPCPWTEAPGPAWGAFRPVEPPPLELPRVRAAALAFPGRGPRGAPPPPPLPPEVDRFLPAELAGAVAKRRAEFLAGRLAAREALRRAAVDHPGLLARGPDREPRWPGGFRGAITHTKGVAWAVVAPADRYRGVGVDLEAPVRPETRDAVRSLVLGPEERADFGEDPDRLTLVFSAKESLYKCLYPTVRAFFGFEAARVTAVDEAAGAFEIALTRELHRDLPAGATFRGRFFGYRPFPREDGPAWVATAIAWETGAT